MLFNSLEYLFFLPVVFLLYWFFFPKNLKAQNVLILVSSYVFYGWWDWRFLSLIFLSSVVDFFVGQGIHNTENKTYRKTFLAVSLIVNLGLLGVFKYYNFFIDNFHQAFAELGINMNVSSLNIILPVGISFYTFQTLSYTIDIYRKSLHPVKDFIAFLSFVSFFPQLVAGPIERASNLLPQFLSNRVFSLERSKDGLRQILWGLFKKVVIADTCATYVNDIFANYEAYSGSVLLLGAVYFAFQIYCDFSGYSDIAIGTAKLFGFNLMTNFALPYFSKSVGEFWRRWHISLSTWFRDYVYIPLGGSKKGKLSQIINSTITFTISGFWHGANWTFIVWGFINGLYYVPSIIFSKQKDYSLIAHNRWYPTIKEVVNVIITFSLILITWIFFRAENITHAIGYLGRLFDMSIFTLPQVFRMGVIYIAILIAIEWLQRRKTHGLEIGQLPLLIRWPIYVVICLSVLAFYKEDQQFIYFQF